MELRQLEHFLAVVEEGTFTRAAERLFLTQPAVSLSIKKLEEEIGSPLFARDVHDLSLTEAGRVLADYSRRMLRLRDDATREMARLGSMTAGSLTVAAHEAAAVYLLPVALRTYVQKFPDIKVGIYRSRLEEIPASGDGPARSTWASSRKRRRSTSCSAWTCTATRWCASPRPNTRWPHVSG
jgi:DNA-binding transcriptional LysR family regulator